MSFLASLTLHYRLLFACYLICSSSTPSVQNERYNLHERKNGVGLKNRYRLVLLHPNVASTKDKDKAIHCVCVFQIPYSRLHSGVCLAETNSVHSGVCLAETNSVRSGICLAETNSVHSGVWQKQIPYIVECGRNKFRT